ncbi:MAG: hypothetical protein GXZ07_01040 [Firmicutes bacterium]|nr:hypothetical protein [Bacillota bacterium]
MGLFVNILFGALAVLVLLTAVLLFMPVRYTIQGGFRERFFFSALIKIKPVIELAGDFGKISSLDLTILGIRFKFCPGKSGKKKKDLNEKGKKEKKALGLSFRSFADGKFLKNLLTFSREILRMIGPESLELQGKVGFEDPCYNGWLAALNWFFKTSIPMQKVKVDLEPVWEEEYVDVAVSISGKVIVCLILYRTIKFLLAAETRKIWKAIRASKKKARYAT